MARINDPRPYVMPQWGRPPAPPAAGLGELGGETNARATPALDISGLPARPGLGEYPQRSASYRPWLIGLGGFVLGFMIS